MNRSEVAPLSGIKKIPNYALHISDTTELERLTSDCLVTVAVPNESKFSISTEQTNKAVLWFTEGGVSLHTQTAACLGYLGCLHILWNQVRGCSDNLKDK